MTLDEQTKLELIQLVKTAVNEAVEQHPLSPDEVHWVRMAIEAQAERAKLRKAIIEKTLAGLIWAAVLGLGYLFVDFLRNHGLKI